MKENREIIQDGGVWFYPKVKVKSVYIGCNTEKEGKELVEKACKEKNIPVHHMVNEKNKSGLTIFD